MELPLGFDAPQNGSCKLYVLCLNKSLYGLKQAGYNWFAKICNGLMDGNFTQSNINACAFFGKGCIVSTYVDDCIIVADLMNHIEHLLHPYTTARRVLFFMMKDQSTNTWVSTLSSSTIPPSISHNHFLLSVYQPFLELTMVTRMNKTLQLVNLFSIKIWMGFLASTRGNIVVR